MAHLFDPIALRGLTARNRAWVSPMCQYRAVAGLPNSWHFVHLGKFAVGGAGLVMAESTAVESVGRISPRDTGMWDEDHVEAWRPVVTFVREQGALAGIQLGHAGRKASTAPPWEGIGYVTPENGGWNTVAPSSAAFGSLPAPRALTDEEISLIVQRFIWAAAFSDEAGFDVVEIHGAHGYLLHQFLSPLSNHRTDKYGGPFENRVRLLLDVVGGVRKEWPDHKPLFVRVSATDWVDGGWSLEETVELARLLGELGVDLVDCSSGGAVPDAKIVTGPSYQVGFAEAVKSKAEVSTAAVGLITEPWQANEIIQSGKADAVMMAREFLRQPHWPLLAASELGVSIDWPSEYERAEPRRR